MADLVLPNRDEYPTNGTLSTPVILPTKGKPSVTQLAGVCWVSTAGQERRNP
jgi:hypothetical protein